MSKKSKKNKARGANTSGSSANTSKESVEDEISLHASDRTLEDRQALHAILPPNWDQLGDLEREFYLQKHRALPVAWKNMDIEQKQNFYRRMGLNMDLSVREDDDPDTVNKPNTFEEAEKTRNAAAEAEADLKAKALKRAQENAAAEQAAIEAEEAQKRAEAAKAREEAEAEEAAKAQEQERAARELMERAKAEKAKREAETKARQVAAETKRLIEANEARKAEKERQIALQKEEDERVARAAQYANVAESYLAEQAQIQKEPEVINLADMERGYVQNPDASDDSLQTQVNPRRGGQDGLERTVYHSLIEEDLPAHEIYQMRKEAIDELIQLYRTIRGLLQEKEYVGPKESAGLRRSLNLLYDKINQNKDQYEKYVSQYSNVAKLMSEKDIENVCGLAEDFIMRLEELFEHHMSGANRVGNVQQETNNFLQNEVYHEANETLGVLNISHKTPKRNFQPHQFSTPAHHLANPNAPGRNNKKRQKKDFQSKPNPPPKRVNQDPKEVGAKNLIKDIKKGNFNKHLTNPSERTKKVSISNKTQERVITQESFNQTPLDRTGPVDAKGQRALDLKFQMAQIQAELSKLEVEPEIPDKLMKSYAVTGKPEDEKVHYSGWGDRVGNDRRLDATHRNENGNFQQESFGSSNGAPNAGANGGGPDDPDDPDDNSSNGDPNDFRNRNRNTARNPNRTLNPVRPEPAIYANRHQFPTHMPNRWYIDNFKGP